MTTRDLDYVLRKKLQAFLKEILSTGTLSGFKYFSLYIRGKEELVVEIVNEPVGSGQHASTSGYNTDTYQCQQTVTPGSSFTSGNIPYDRTSLMLSQTTQLKLSGYGDEGIGLPPASPSEQETVEEDSGTTLFLLACYSRYGCPYVWVRSNHQRLIKLNQHTDRKDRDNPLKLKTTNNWRKQDCHISEILAELVKLCARPAPVNPLAIDFNYLTDLPEPDRLLITGALMQFLENAVLITDENKYYIPHVLEDYNLLTMLHMKTLHQMMNTGQITATT